MENQSKTPIALWIGIAIAVLLSGLAFVIASQAAANPPSQVSQSGAVAGLTSTEGEYIAANGFGVGVEKAFVTIANVVNGLVYQYEGSASAIETEAIEPVSCVASSTIFTLNNPLGATSTATLLSFNGVGNATTTLLNVAATAQGFGGTSLTGTEVINASIATSSAFTVSAGTVNGPSNTFVSSGASSVAQVVVAPNQALSGFATTTATGAGAAGFVPGYTSCSGFVVWKSM